MTKSAMIKEMIIQLLSDGSSYTVSQMKIYLIEKDLKDYSEGQFAGSVDNLLKNKKIEKVGRGIYRIAGVEMILAKERDGIFMKKCFVVSPVAICQGLFYQNSVFILCTSLSHLTSSCTLTIIVNVHELIYLEVI